MTRNPLLLTTICLVHRDRGGSLPDRRARLYEESIQILLDLWRAPKGIPISIQADVARRVLQPVALWMHGQSGRTQADAAEITPVIEPELERARAPVADATRFLELIRDESGLLTGWSGERYGFMHLGFQEYLAAREIRRLALEDGVGGGADALVVLARRFGESWWREVTLLLLALEEPSAVDRFFRTLLDLPELQIDEAFLQQCVAEAAVKSVAPFVDFVRRTVDGGPGFPERQLAALRVIEAAGASALDDMAPLLVRSPAPEIRSWLHERARAAAFPALVCEPGSYELVQIPGGISLIGSPETEEGRFAWEGPQHLVDVAPFWMGRYPVTNQQYGLFLQANPRAAEPGFWAERRFNQPAQPVVGVSWEEARAYADWAGLRLPSEAEWEHACRGWGLTRYYTGDDEVDLDRAGWYDGNSGNATHAVGKKEPNDFGLHDMHGNVWEWVEDDAHYDYKGAPRDGEAWVDFPRVSRRVGRGGSWGNPARSARSACRGSAELGNRRRNVGFRLARSIP